MIYEEKLQVNAALGELLQLPPGSPEWIVPARIVVRHVSHIRESSFHQMHYRRRKSGRNVSGYTDEAGTVDIRTDKSKVVEKTYGLKEERVGYYKLHRLGKTIYVQHFWNSPLGIEPVLTYQLTFKKLEPISFGVQEEVAYGSFRIRFSVVYLNYIQGRNLGKRKLCGWELRVIKM